MSPDVQSPIQENYAPYDVIPLPREAPAWVTRGEIVVAPAAAKTPVQQLRSVPITLFESFHHGADMARQYARPAPIVGAALAHAARIRGTTRYYDTEAGGPTRGWK